MGRRILNKRCVTKVHLVTSKEDDSNFVLTLRLAPPIALVVLTFFLALYTYKLAKFSSTQSEASISASQAAKSSAETANISLEIAENSLKYADEANRIAKEAGEKTEKFAIINAEVQWDGIMESYDKVDISLEEWEKSKNLKREGKIIKSRSELENELKQIEAPDNIKRLYVKRFDKYQIMENLAKQYKPFSQRMTHIDFTLPSPPKLPKGGRIIYSPSGAKMIYSPSGGKVGAIPPKAK